MELLEVKAGAKAKAGASPEVHSCILAKKKQLHFFAVIICEICGSLCPADHSCGHTPTPTLCGRD